MGQVIPLRPVRNALFQLQQMQRMELKRDTIRYVLSELQCGRDGMAAAQALQTHRLRQIGGAPHLGPH